jgi:hypothetical protein
MQVPAGGGLLGNKGGNECYDAYGKYICAVSHTRTEQGTRTDQITDQHGHLRGPSSVIAHSFLSLCLSLFLSLSLLFFALRLCCVCAGARSTWESEWPIHRRQSGQQSSQSTESAEQQGQRAEGTGTTINA